MFKGKNLAMISSLVCMAMAILILVFQFLPYWSFVGEKTGEQTISISGYVWLPNNDVSNDFEELAKAEIFPGERITDNKIVNEIVMFPAFTFGFCALAIAVCLLKLKNGIMPTLFTIIAGVVATVGYLVSPALSLFDAPQMLHLIISIVVTVVALVLFVANVMAWTKKNLSKNVHTNVAA